MTLLKLSLGGIGQHIIATSSWIGLVRIISVFGSTVVAGYTIALRIMVFALLFMGPEQCRIDPRWAEPRRRPAGPGGALSVGHGLGQHDLLRLGRTLLIVFSEFFVRLFINDPAVITAGSNCLRIISVGFIAYGFGMVLVNALNGAGDTFTPTVINVFCYWLLEIPLAWFLALHSGLNETGVFISIVIAETIMTLTAFWLFRKGNWKLKKV